MSDKSADLTVSILGSPEVCCFLLLGLVQLVDVGEPSLVVVGPQRWVAVVTSSNKAVLRQELAGQVGEVGVLDSGHPVFTKKNLMTVE